MGPSTTEREMRPLTHQVWEKHYVMLRPHILERWPRVDRLDLEAIADDYDGLVELVQRATGMSADDVYRELRTLDVEEIGIGPGEEPDYDGDGRASLAQLRLGAGFTEDDREEVERRLEKLNRRLRRFPAEGTELLLTVNDRDSTAQRVTLQCLAPHYAPFVATSNETDLRAALSEVREELWRQISDAVSKRREGRR
jgi:ribosome-associated translation inhibitor RaiA